MESEYEFVLPRGYWDSEGNLHRRGRMRPAIALDEIEVMADARLASNWALLPALLLSRVVTRLGDLETPSPEVMVGLYALDLAYLADLYQRLNGLQTVTIGAHCPHCARRFDLQVAPLEAPATSW